MFARALVALVLACAAAPFAAAQFTAGNIAVLRIGDPPPSSLSQSVAGSIFQFNATGQVVNGGTTSSYVPGSSTAAATLTPGSSGIVFSGPSTFEQGLNRSADGSTLVVAGYANTTGVAGVASNSPDRTVARIGASGIATYQTFTGGPFGTGGIRAVASIDGGQVWMSGANTGIVTAAATGSSFTTVSTTIPGNKFLDIYGSTNSLFAMSSTTGQGVYMVGSGAAPTMATSSTQVFGLPTDANGFWMADRSSQNYLGTGLDTAYVLSQDKVLKYEFDGTNWLAKGSATINNPGGGGVGTLSGAYITGAITGSGNVELYATFDPSATTSNNYLIKLTDSTPYGTPLSTLSMNWSVPAGADYSFRGLDSTPSVTPEPAAVLGLAALGLGAVALVRRKL